MTVLAEELGVDGTLAKRAGAVLGGRATTFRTPMSQTLRHPEILELARREGRVTVEGLATRETHGELVVKVRRWLASVDGQEVANLTAVEAVNQGAELTKEALRLIAQAAPAPVATTSGRVRRR